MPSLKEAPLYIRWSPDRSPYAIELKLDLVSRIAKELAEAEKLGIEIGGVLIGWFPTGRVPTLRIDDLEMISRRPEDGPVYMLDPDQHKRFAEARDRAMASGRTAIGFCRSHVRPGPLKPSLADRSLLSGQFSEAAYVVLLIQEREPRTAAVFVAADGQLSDEPAIREFRFDEAEFKALPEIQIDSAAREEDSGPTTRGKSRWVKPIVIPLLIAIAALGIFGLISQGILPPFWIRSSSTQFDLAVTENDRLLRISWNRAARELDRASGARLVIADGASRQEIRLGQDELKLGTVDYQPDTQQVQITMTLNTQDGAQPTQSVEWKRK